MQGKSEMRNKDRPEHEEGCVGESVNEDGEYVRRAVHHDQLVDVRLLFAFDHLHHHKL